jgi:hypothetical protein
LSMGPNRMQPMKTTLNLSFILLFSLSSCGKGDGKTERCRSAEEAQMMCQIAYVENYQLMIIPEWVKKQCVDLYPSGGCYFDSSKRYYW